MIKIELSRVVSCYLKTEVFVVEQKFRNATSYFRLVLDTFSFLHSQSWLHITALESYMYVKRNMYLYAHLCIFVYVLLRMYGYLHVNINHTQTY